MERKGDKKRKKKEKRGMKGKKKKQMRGTDKRKTGIRLQKRSREER